MRGDAVANEMQWHWHGVGGPERRSHGALCKEQRGVTKQEESGAKRETQPQSPRASCVIISRLLVVS